MISIIAAVDKDWAIGKKGSLPWYLPAELLRFKKITTGHPIIMGRKTYESIGKPLVGRINIVVTRQSNWQKDGVFVFSSLEKAMEYAGKSQGSDEIFIIGGSEIFKQTIDVADKLYLTFVDGRFGGDVFFPTIDLVEWKEIDREKYSKDAKNNCDFEFVTYERKKGR